MSGTVARSLGNLADTLGTTATANVNIDNGVLFVDSVNNRVGVSTASPSAGLDVRADVFTNGTVRIDKINSAIDIRPGASDFSSVVWRSANGSTTFANIGPEAVGSGSLWVNGSTNVYLATGGTERMRISATGVVNLGATMYNGVGSTILSTRGAVVCSALQEADRSYETHNFNTYPNLYSTVFINISASSNNPAGATGNGYRFVMGAGDTGGRGFDLVGTSAGQLFFRARENGTWYQATATIPSDYRIKENITPIQSPLQALKNIKPVTFDFKDIPNPGSNTGFTTYQWSNDGTPQLGFIAHELQEVIPSAVNGEKDAVTDVGGIQPQTLNVMPIVALLAASLKEVTAKLEAAEAAIEELKSKIEER